MTTPQIVLLVLAAASAAFFLGMVANDIAGRRDGEWMGVATFVIALASISALVTTFFY